MSHLGLFLIVLALVCFVLAAVGVSSGRVNLIGAGLASLTLWLLIGGRW